MRIVFGSGNSQYRGYADKIGIDFDKKIFCTDYYALGSADFVLKSTQSRGNVIKELETYYLRGFTKVEYDEWVGHNQSKEVNNGMTESFVIRDNTDEVFN